MLLLLLLLWWPWWWLLLLGRRRPLWLLLVLLLVLLFLQLPCLHLKLLRSVLLLGTLCRRASRIGTLCCAHRTPKQ